MSTRGEIVSNMNQWCLNRPGITTEIRRRILNQIYLSLAMPFRFHELETTHDLSIVSGTSSYEIDSDDMYAIHYARDLENGKRLEWMDWDEYTRLDDHTLTGYPESVTRYGNNVYIYPTPDFTLNPGIRLYGLKLPDPMDDDNDVPVYPKDWHFILELSASAMCCFLFAMNERGMMLQNLALGQLSGRQEAHTLEAFFRHMRVTVEKSRPTPNFDILRD